MALVYDDDGNLYDDGTVDDSTNIDYGYTTKIGGVDYTKDANGKWTYEDELGKHEIAQDKINELLSKDTSAANDVALKEKLKTPGFVDQLNKLFGTNKSLADYLKMGMTGLGGLAGMSSLNQPKVTPTGYQGGIPELTAYQPMLTEPPPGRRPGSGGINYGTGVQYKDKDGKIVSDTSTSLADLYRKATQEGTYNEWGHNSYGQIPTPTTIKHPPIYNPPPTGTVTPLPEVITSPPKGTVTPPNAGIKQLQPSTSSGATGGFTAGGGGPMNKADYDKAVAAETARRNAEKAALDEWHISPSSPFYAASKGLTGQALDNLKSQDKDFQERITRRQAASDTFANAEFYGTGTVKDAQGNDVAPKENETGRWVSFKDGTSRYITKAEQEAMDKRAQQALMDQGNIIDKVHPWNVTSDNAPVQDVQKWLTELNKTQGTPEQRQQALQDAFAKIGQTGQFKDTDIQAASNGLWSLSDIDKLLGKKVTTPTQSTADSGPPVGSPKPVVFGGVQNEPNEPTAQTNTTEVTTPKPVVFGGVQNEPAAPATPSLASLAQSIYKRDLTPDEQATLSGKSIGDAQSIMEQSMANWNASHPQVMAKGGLTNLDHGGFVIPADVVSHFGNGSSDAGLKLLGKKLGATPIRGHGDGMSDSIPAAIEGREKALVANEEAYLTPAMVAKIGGGDIDTGSKRLKHMMENIRKARTGNKKQGKQVDPTKFMPGGLVGYAEGGDIKRYAGTDPTGSLVQAGVTGTEQNLSNWAGKYTTDMMGKAAALANTPYQAYTGPLTAGASGLQNLAFQNAANLPNGALASAYGNMAINNQYTPQTTDFLGRSNAPQQQYTHMQTGGFKGPMPMGRPALGSAPYKDYFDYTMPETAGPAAPYSQAEEPELGPPRETGGPMEPRYPIDLPYPKEPQYPQQNSQSIAQQYMNPYLQASLDPQLAEARRQSEITAQQNNAAMTKAGAFGGGRQAILTSENQRNLGSNLANITGTGYNNAYDKAMAQFNADQNRRMQEQQFVNTSNLAGINTGLNAEQIASGIGINNLNTQAALGATERGIESEGIAADKAQFEEARKDPYTKLQFQQSFLNGMPITAQNYNMSQPSALTQFAQGATSVDKLMQLLGIK
jgi:hypothetical protein